jgi:Uma2 family endonuclease
VYLPAVPITIELPDLKSQTRFNLARWTEILADPFLAKIPNRIESDRHGRIVMLPLPDVLHARRLGSIVARLSKTAANGTPLTICPVSTADGVKAVDVAWLANAAGSELDQNTEVLTKAPEICIEVVGRFDTPSEISERRVLYFDAGAAEVWICNLDGSMSFFVSRDHQVSTSSLCPAFPDRIR